LTLKSGNYSHHQLNKLGTQNIGKTKNTEKNKKGTKAHKTPLKEGCRMILAKVQKNHT
jgi:hypothetical protein